jgi:hypothetical protein
VSPVGGSRHYDGRGLGQIGLWGCPSCGEDNTGPLVQGCVHCGAGRPAEKSEAPTPPVPRVSERTPDDPTYDDNQVQQGDNADYWARQHGGVSIAEAYRAGYLDGIRAARAAQPAPPPPASALSTPAAWRTMAVALALFRDNVLAARPEEVERGEWLTADEASQAIDELQTLLAGSGEEVLHG